MIVCVEFVAAGFYAFVFVLTGQSAISVSEQAVKPDSYSFWLQTTWLIVIKCRAAVVFFLMALQLYG